MAINRKEPHDQLGRDSSSYVSAGYRDQLARRLFSCPACGSHWVVFTATGAEVVGVRSAKKRDPERSALVCELCLTPVDHDGRIVFDGRSS